MSTARIDISNLTFEQRVFLEQRLKEKRGRVANRQTIPRRTKPGPAPLSCAQRRLWFLDQLDPGHTFYNATAAVRLTGRLDVPALECALDEIIQRHEILRTVFTAEEGRPVQIVQSRAFTNLPIHDLRELPAHMAEARAAQICADEAKRSFDLASGPLVRAGLLRLRADEHVLLLTMHHIIGDGWSIGVCMRELAAFYETYALGRPCPLKELPIQYGDFAHWQHQSLQGETFETQLSYWKQRLADAPPLLHLPTDRPRGATQSFSGATEQFAISRAVSEELRALSRRENVTLFMTLLAAFQTLLFRYTGQRQILTGSPVAGRNWSETEGLIGCFLNMLVLRTDLAGNPTFRELLARVREVTLGAMAHQDLPFEKLVEELQLERDLSRNPLFQVMFALQNTPQTEMRLADLQMSIERVESGTARVDLYLSIEDTEQLNATLEYNTDLWDASTTRRMMGHFKNLLDDIVANPERRVSELTLLDQTERNQLIAVWNDTHTKYRHERCLHQLFEERVTLTPDRVAVVFEGKQLTYDQLNRRANQLAHYLRRLGVATETPVGISAQPSIEMVIGLLGVLKAGGTYLPLDPAYPQERLRFMANDARIRVLLTQKSLSEHFPDSETEVVFLDHDQIDDEREDNPACASTPANLAYIIYTSGSSGGPKGVQISHRAVVNFLSSMANEPGLERDDVLLAVTSLSFDIAGLEIFLPLVVGARVEIASRETASDGLRLRELLERSGASVMQATPATWRMMLESGWKNACGLKVLCGGEALPVDLARQLLDAGCVLWNMYGPTETTIWSTCKKLDQSEISIGRPIANTQLYVLDEFQQPVPIGVSGELYIGGDGLARGYLGRAELTAEKFVPDPFDECGGARLYRTGDLVRCLPGGDVEYVGRIDHQVKVRGYRIEVAEIEVVLSEHPAVREAVVTAQQVENAEKRLVAYFVTDEELGTGELQQYIRTRLPPYMVPSLFVRVDAMPLTPNGKIDRAALPAPEQMRPELGGEYVAPRTPAEEVLAGIWSVLLRVEKVGVHDNFFELGGHSLLATQLVSRVREAFGVEMAVRELFEHPTVAGLAAAIEEMLNAGHGVQAPPIVKVSREAELPLSYGQQRLWFLDQLEPGSSAYNMGVAVRLQGTLVVDVLAQSFTEIVRRHESLRTRFGVVDGRPVPLIDEIPRFSLPVFDLSTLSEEERDSEARRLAKEETSRPFDLLNGPLLRASVLRLGAEEFMLLATMHHITGDGWSLGILVRELTTLYEAFSAGRPSPLPDLTIQYADYAHWQREWLQGEVLEKQLSYWKQQMADAPPVLELPADYARPQEQSFRGEQLSITFSDRLSAQVQQLSRREGVTLFMTLLAAWQILLSRYSGQQDIVVGSPTANRNRSETESLIGFFVNTLVLRTDLSGDPRFVELLRRVREVALGAYAHQDVPFEKLVEELQPERDLSRSPLFQVMLVHQNGWQAALQITPGLQVSDINVENQTEKFDVTLTTSETQDGRLQSVWGYNPDLFAPSTIERMMRHFEMLLESVASNPEQHLSELVLLTAEEREQMLVAWNDTAAAYPHEKLLHQLFEGQVARTPEAVAIAYEGGQLSYRELDSRANHLAGYLQKLGVGPEVLVGICVERSVEMMVGLLGTLKAGGAYVPIDPSYPPERVSFLLADCRANVLLTQQHIAESVETEAKVICLDQLICEKAESGVSSGVISENLAYVIYTSGSTGKPKGVMISHRALINYLWWAVHEYDVAHGTGVPLHSSIAFDLTVTSLFCPLLAGRTITLPRERAGIEALSEALVGNDQSLIKVTPTHLRALNNLFPEDSLSGRTRVLVIGGEALPAETIATWRQHAPQTRIVNEYGPTEATVGCCVYEVKADDPQSGEVLIGRPIANTQIYILDTAMQPVPVGVIGELYIGGAGVARGYHGRPELTAERFVPDPHSGMRLYRTGDLARYLPDGRIEFLGRMDHQVKVRGFRIELGEVEAALATHPEVREAVVVAQEDTGQLVAYVVGKFETSLAAAELRQYLKQKLPEHMVPTAFVSLEMLPLTPSGKIDRRALPAPEPGVVQRTQLFVAPRSAVEEVVAGIWSELLHIDHISIHDNFFDIGGHSLLATQIISRLRAIFKVDVPVRRIFEHPVLADLAQAIESSLRAAEGFVAQPIQPIARDGEMPLSFAQQRLWLMDQVEPGNPSYNLGAALRVKGPLDIPALEASLNEIIRRHEILRTRFPSVEGRPVQVIADAVPLDLCVIDLGAFGDEREQHLKQLAATEAQTPFDLAQGPLLRVRLLRLDPEDHALLLTVHHIAGDGWSVGVLMREFKVLYEAYSMGHESPLPEPAIQYIDFAHWQREWLQGEVLDRQLTYWKQQLAGAPALLELPADHPRPAVQSFRGARETITISSEVLTKLKQLSREEGVTLFMTLLAAFKTLLWRYSRQEDIVVGTPIANRTTAEVEDLIGFFVNTLVLRTSLRGEPSFRELLGRVREVSLAAYTHQDLPFEKLVEELQIERSLGHNALFQVWFVLQNAPAEELQLPGLVLEQLEFEKRWVRHDLRLDMLETSGGLTGSFEYRTDLFDAPTIRQMARNFETLLDHLANEPEMKIDRLAQLLTEADNRQQTLREQEFITAANQRLQNIKIKAMNRARLKEISK
ncbi:MAG TPA: amino acid adenylation domain-containing protein [Pyrinomonadaceae bacterium]|nr:amino acid adenylation domain-containing protein [Pyrinomonadaceae bacterium]